MSSTPSNIPITWEDLSESLTLAMRAELISDDTINSVLATLFDAIDNNVNTDDSDAPGGDIADEDQAHTDDAYRNAAMRLKHRDIHCEIDGDAEVSASADGGAYVRSWVWIGDEEVGPSDN